jgi:DNA-binding NarL/FixJ family response regulator
MKPIKLILADDHQLFRDGIKSLLEDIADIQVIGEASNGAELLKMLPSLEPQIVILDITMPDISGIEITKTIQNDYPQISVLILSMHNEEEFIINAIKSGAKGYLPKDIDKTELLQAINTIHEGEEYFSKDISEVFLKNFIRRTKVGLEGDHPILTTREIEVVKLVSEGYKNQEIAEKLFISVRTVDAHKNNIIKKLKLKSTVDIVKFAIKNNLIKL